MEARAVKLPQGVRRYWGSFISSLGPWGGSGGSYIVKNRWFSHKTTSQLSKPCSVHNTIHCDILGLEWWEATLAWAHGTANIWPCLGEEREIKGLSKKQTPQPGKLQLWWTASPFTPHPASCPPQPHPLGPDPLLALEAFPTLSIRQVQGVGRDGHLGSGAREEPSWLELDPPEGITDTGPVSFSGVWSRRMDSFHLGDVGTVTRSSPFVQAACPALSSQWTLGALRECLCSNKPLPFHTYAHKNEKRSFKTLYIRSDSGLSLEHH